MSKTYETWQAVKALTEHGDWKAFAPGTDELFAAILESHCGELHQEVGSGASLGEFERAEPHDSAHVTSISLNSVVPWRLYDSNGNEVTDYD